MVCAVCLYIFLSPATRRCIQLFVYVNIKENIKVRVTGPL